MNLNGCSVLSLFWYWNIYLHTVSSVCVSGLWLISWISFVLGQGREVQNQLFFYDWINAGIYALISEN